MTPAAARAALLADATIADEVGDGVHVGTAPAGARQPYVTLNVVSEIPERDLDAVAADRVLLQLDVYAETYAAGDALLRAAIVALTTAGAVRQGGSREPIDGGAVAAGWRHRADFVTWTTSPESGV
ncbi:MAG: DUF3168 domain-containing protein [Pseudomonadota bacterium]